MTDRGRYLLVSDVHILRSWGQELKLMFDGMPYLVGSALQRPDYRDVDVRLMLDDDRYDALMATGVKLSRLNLAVSVWGQKVTGLPIDFQVQRVTDANAEFNGPRDPIGIDAQRLEQAEEAARRNGEKA